jgi:hypothetical protein
MSAHRFPRKPLAYGVGGVLVGLLVTYIGYGVIARGTGTAADLGAGFTVVIGLTLIIVSFFAFLLPPLIPAR